MAGRSLPARARLFVFATTAAAAGVVWYAATSEPRFDVKIAVGFGLLALLAEQFPIATRFGSSYSITFVVTIAAIIVGGAGEAALAATVGSLCLLDGQIRRRAPIRHLFNTAQLALTTGVAGLVYRALGGPIGNPSHILPRALLPLALAAAADFAVNTGLVATVISLAERMPIVAVWRTNSRPLLPAYFAFTALGLLLAVLFQTPIQTPMRWGSVLFLLVPLLVARRAFQTAIRMQGAFDATMKTLVAAIEAKDPYTRGHAERVSRLAEMTARAYGLAPDPARHVAYAALVHDIGKLAVETRVLRKAGALTDAEYHHMRSHTAKGLEIVSEIDLLKDVLQGILHHHERFDGTGYPDGLARTQIPLAARLIAVADAFDSITSSRTYRTPRSSHEALAELKACAGTQFDPKAIEALEKALAKHGWKPDPHASRANRAPDAPPAREGNAARSRGYRARSRLAERMAGGEPLTVGRTVGAEIPS